MHFKIALAFLIGCAVAADPTKNESRDLAADIIEAQKELSTFIQEALKFRSTYQLILNADILLEVNNNFYQIYSLMQTLGVDQATIDGIKAIAEQDINVMTVATDNLESANLDMINGAYVINSILRNGTLTDLRSNYDLWMGEAYPLFLQRYRQYFNALSVTGNVLELEVAAAINGLEGSEVTAIYVYLQKTNDRINADAALMEREVYVYDFTLNEARLAVEVVMFQVPPSLSSI
ncbi:uncharacterized protein LOC135934677 [Cloeon dipterum]|uniref:uncharacterized protein LOC135934677 n=1 Tax=Cloeon dipterum TaxID=197152 RepID=UPI0032204952